MSKAADIAKLAVLADLMLDHRLTALQQAARAKLQSEAALSGLDARPAETDSLVGASAALASLNYQRWADVRRSEINLTLARQTQEWLEARDQARTAFGKAEAIRALSEKLARK